MPPDEGRNAYAAVTEDGAYLIVVLQEGYLSNAVHYRRMDEPDSAIRPLLDEWDAVYGYVANDGDTFFFSTNRDAPRRKVISLDINSPREWTEIVPEGENTLLSISAVGGRLIASYLQDVKPLVLVHEADGSLVEQIGLPGIGSVSGFGGKWDRSRNVLQLLRLYRSRRRLPLRRGHGREHAAPPHRNVDRRHAVRDPPGLLRQQGRYPGPDVPRAPQATWKGPATTPRCCTATAASTYR